jgi:hypothetical protein
MEQCSQEREVGQLDALSLAARRRSTPPLQLPQSMHPAGIRTAPEHSVTVLLLHKSYLWMDTATGSVLQQMLPAVLHGDSSLPLA